ncbi:hypothetical protein CAEBREN_17116 [Caenorhabditis brenneri]|uniref:Uncharacterized protein n=1 Tax=Caenorhabditis brenneri TaxID=135651 RepID=G0MBW1_CAEBE|nr:hypothetical protein CAEBREN_17116 [Caenorhabditis brenneri]
MLKDLIPSTNDTFPTFIYRKLNTLGSNPTKSDLDFINELINEPVQEEERVVPHEEVQEWKKLEKKALNDQNSYKKETKIMTKTEKYLIRFSFSLLLLVCFCWKILPYMLEDDENSEDPMLLLLSWPIDFIAVAIYIFCLYGSNLGALKPVKHQVLENEDDDDDWQDSMTSTELLSMQKVLVNEWNKLEKERTEQLARLRTLHGHGLLRFPCLCDPS